MPDGPHENLNPIISAPTPVPEEHEKSETPSHLITDEE